MDLIGTMLLPSPFDWITFIIFIILINFILFNKYTLAIIKTDVDQIFADKEPQIWDDFDIAPELKVQNNDK